MKALDLVVSDKKIFENCIFKTYFLTLWPIYATNWNGLNNFDRGPPRDHSCEVWSKSNEWFQRRRCFSTRGPRGPWVAHLRKRSKVTVEPIIENPRGIIWATLVKDLSMMLYIKYESTGPCSFRQEDFWKFHFKNLFIDPMTYLCNQP